MDTNKFIYKSDETFWFASEAGLNAEHQYDRVGPGKQLRWSSRLRARQHRESNATCTGFRTSWPMRIGTAQAAPSSREVKKTDILEFVGPSGGQGASTVKGLGLVPLLAGDAIMEGAAPEVCAREFFERQEVNGPNESMPFFTSTPYLKANPVGSEANDIAEDIGMGMLNCQTFRRWQSWARTREGLGREHQVRRAEGDRQGARDDPEPALLHQADRLRRKGRQLWRERQRDRHDQRRPLRRRAY